MPKLHGFRVLKFVAKNWVPPDQKHTLVDLTEWAKTKGSALDELIERIAQVLDTAAARYAEMARLCATVNHPETALEVFTESGPVFLPRCRIMADERSCVISARRAAECTRSPDRPRFVVVDVRLD